MEALRGLVGVIHNMKKKGVALSADQQTLHQQTELFLLSWILTY